MTEARTWVKTPKGISEVEKKTHGLALKARQVLIMIDGKRDMAALQGIFPPEMVQPTLEQLLAEGFIRALESAQPLQQTPSRKAPEAANEGERFDLARNFMLNTTSAFLGIVGSSLSGKIERADDLAALNVLYGEWHEALSLVPDAKKRLPELNVQILRLLGDLPAAGPAVQTRLAPAAKPNPPAHAPRPKNEEERLTMARAFMANTTTTFIGIAGSSLIDRIDQAENIAGLRRLYYDWREAMQLAPDAKARLPDLEQRLAALLS